MAVRNILYEHGEYFVIKARKGYEVYRNGVTAATRCAIIGSDGEKWLKRAIEECDRRAKEELRCD